MIRLRTVVRSKAIRTFAFAMIPRGMSSSIWRFAISDGALFTVVFCQRYLLAHRVDAFDRGVFKLRACRLRMK
jgi:hypothetical protein